MEFLRSLFFYLLFYIWTIFYFVIFSQVRFFSKNFTVKIAEFWSVSVMKLTSRILLIDYEVEGKENIPDKPFIIASNHQSAWETFFLPIIFTRSVFILKKNLKNRRILQKRLPNGSNKMTLFLSKCLLAHLWWSKPFL